MAMRRRCRLLLSLLAAGLAMNGCATRAPQATLAAAPAAPTASQGDGDPQGTLATFRIIRRVAMYYRLDLKRDNSQAATMAKVMAAHESEVRDCYSARLDADPRLHGQLDLTFQLSRSTGMMGRIARAGGDLVDDTLFRCISRELALLPFNPPKDMRGTLQYTFDAKETVEPQSP